jgi:hypothetical protein
VEEYIMTMTSNLEYNKKIPSLLLANMDICLLDTYACATYIIDYINKSNRGVLKMLTDIISEIHHGDNIIRGHFRTVVNACVNSSEINAQEAAWSLPRLRCHM